jgi:4-amino-4-deoxy-L-arabinose transferase-like glycosyltransferase
MRAALLALVLLAAVLRGNGISQGLPGLYDPDEPLFLINALELLAKQTLMPGWFGHPGITTLYLLGASDLAVFLGGRLAGVWTSTSEFAARLYGDPSLVVLAGRGAIMAMALGVVAATAWLGARLGDAKAGLLAALLLAVSPLHTEISGLVRTDIMVSLFCLLAMLAAVRITETGRRRDLIVAGLWMGTAVSTKWPGAVLALAPLLAWCWAYRADRARWLPGAAMLAGAMLLAMAVLMPPLWLRPLDVWHALQNEVQPAHVGATGGNWLFNMGWYAHVLWDRGLGWAALLVPVGVAVLIRQRTMPGAMPALLILVIPMAALIALLCSQANVWQRWLVLPMPMLALIAGLGLAALARHFLTARKGWVMAGIGLIVAAPMGLTAWSEGIARANPTQARAVAFMLNHVPAGSRITVEMLAFPLLKGNWTIRYPFGPVGCVDGRQLLAGRVNYDDAAGAQKGKQKLVLGTINPARIASCWTDYAIIHDADRWLAEAGRYPQEAGVYRAFINGGTVIGDFRPIPGVSAGPRTLVIRLGPQPPSPLR